MTPRALNTKYIAVKHEQETTTASGIFLSPQQETLYARIVSVGDEIKNPLAVDAVAIVNWSLAMPFKHQGQEYFIVDTTAVFAEV